MQKMVHFIVTRETIEVSLVYSQNPRYHCLYIYAIYHTVWVLKESFLEKITLKVASYQSMMLYVLSFYVIMLKIS